MKKKNQIKFLLIICRNVVKNKRFSFSIFKNKIQMIKNEIEKYKI